MYYLGIFNARKTGKLPDYISLLSNITTSKDDDYLIDHLGNFIKFLMKLGLTHQIRHLAIVFAKEQYDFPNVVQSADVTCLRLY